DRCLSKPFSASPHALHCASCCSGLRAHPVLVPQPATYQTVFGSNCLRSPRGGSLLASSSFWTVACLHVRLLCPCVCKFLIREQQNRNCVPMRIDRRLGRLTHAAALLL